MEEAHNVILIFGNTYECREELDKIGYFDPVTKAYLAPISRGDEVNELASKYQLTTTSLYDSDYTEPRNEMEWKLAITKGKISQANIDLQELKKRKEEISEEIDIDNLEISINQTKRLIETLEEKKVYIEECLKRNETQTFVFNSLSEFEIDWFNIVPPKQPMLLKNSKGRGFLPRGIVALMASPGGTGKTRFVTQLAFCVSAGLPFLEEFTNVSGKGARVFLGLGEEPTDGIRRRLYEVAQHYQSDQLQPKFDINEVKRNLVPYSFHGQDVSLVDDHGLATQQYTNLLNALKESEGEGYDLIILDPLSRFLGSSSETDNNNGTKFISLMERMTKELKGNPTVFLVHHTNKANDWRSQNASRGSSSIPAGARWQFNLINEFSRQTAKENDQNKIQEKLPLKNFVRGDLVKNNDVPPIESDIILKFSEGGVLVPITEEEIKKNCPKNGKENDSGENYYANRYGQ